MPPTDKKWDAVAERDLAIAIIQAQQGDRPKHDWHSVHATMTGLNYKFTRDAISQHWTKSIMKDFRIRHGESPTKGGTSAPPSTPASGKKGTPASSAKRSATKRVKQEEGGDDDDDDARVDDTPTKRRKLPAAKPKKEPKTEDNGRERSATIVGHDVDAFEEWMAEGN